jgi:hypothetical protein
MNEEEVLPRRAALPASLLADVFSFGDETGPDVYDRG